MSKKLKPCPFCGKEARLEHWKYNGDMENLDVRRFDSPGYECSVLSIAYIDPSNNNLELLTVLLESY